MERGPGQRRHHPRVPGEPGQVTNHSARSLSRDPVLTSDWLQGVRGDGAAADQAAAGLL